MSPRLSDLRTIFRRRPGRLLVQTVTLGALVAGTAAWSLTDTTVRLSVDGSTRSVSTHGGHVRDVLAAASLTAGAHDLLIPDAGTTIHAGETIVMRHGRLLNLTVDGVSRQVWVTAASVGEAMDQLGLRTDAIVSASRSRSIPLSGLTLDVTEPKSVTILADGHVTRIVTTVATVRDALIQAHIRLRPADLLSAPRPTPLADGMTIRVTRIDGHRENESLPIPFTTEQRPDPSHPRGTSVVLQQGQPGVLLRTYTLYFVNGKFHSKLMSREVVASQPVPQIVSVGTGAPAATYAPTSNGLNWGALARCESGGNPRAVSSNGAYRGLYQFTFGTWRSVGGSGDPIDASSSEQTYRAQLLYNRDGRSPWPVCGRYL